MRFYKSAVPFSLLALVSCASTPRVTGYSSTTPEIRAQVLSRISEIEKNERNCASLSAVVADDPGMPQFMKSQNTRVFSTGPIFEAWVLTACGVQRKYTVALMSDHGAIELRSVELAK